MILWTVIAKVQLLVQKSERWSKMEISTRRIAPGRTPHDNPKAVHIKAVKHKTSKNLNFDKLLQI